MLLLFLIHEWYRSNTSYSPFWFNVIIHSLRTFARSFPSRTTSLFFLSWCSVVIHQSESSHPTTHSWTRFLSASLFAINIEASSLQVSHFPHSLHLTTLRLCGVRLRKDTYKFVLRYSHSLAHLRFEISNLFAPVSTYRKAYVHEKRSYYSFPC